MPGVLGLLSYLLFGSSPEAPATQCECHCSWDLAAGSPLLDAVRLQLERCGPERLSAHCPACPPCSDPSIGAWREAASNVCVFLLGVAAATLWWRPAPPGVAAARLQPAARDNGPEREHQFAIEASPSRRALGRTSGLRGELIDGTA